MTAHRRRLVIGSTLLALALFLVVDLGSTMGWPWQDRGSQLHSWSSTEQAVLESLWLESLPPLPPDPSNLVGDDARAAALGQRLFFDPRLSANGQVSCATCHQPDQYFTDGLAVAQAIGQTDRSTPSIVGLAYSPWFYWDGRRDSQWAQALTPLEAAVEHGGSRTLYARLTAQHYADAYQELFGPLPDLTDSTRFPVPASPLGDETARANWTAMDRIDQEIVNRLFSNVGKAIAAYERLIIPGSSPFDDYVAALAAGDEESLPQILSADQVAGLRLFIGAGQCIRCHNGPLFTNFSFHNVGAPSMPDTALDQGRSAGVGQTLTDPFNCLGPYSDAGPEQCAELRFVKKEGEELVGAFKTPSLRNVAQTAPYMHRGQYETLLDVVDHYSRAPMAFPGHSDAEPLGLTATEQAQLSAFLETLTGPLAGDPQLLRADGF